MVAKVAVFTSIVFADSLTMIDSSCVGSAEILTISALEA